MGSEVRDAVARAIFDTAVGKEHWENPWYREEREGCFYSARAAIAAYREATGWQPIETAPRGGEHPYSRNLEERSTFVLLWNGHHMGVGYGEIEGGQLQWWGEDIEPVEPPPTHWMPLPEPPDA